MAKRSSTTFAKRQKEMARKEKRQQKLERRLERRLNKGAVAENPESPEAGASVDDAGAETAVSVETVPAAESD